MFMGQQDDEAFKEWARGGKDRAGGDFSAPTKETPVFDPLMRGSVLHGDESLGLGTSTFLEGTPAARTAIQKKREEEMAAEVMGEGLQRKKSLAHRIRNMNRGGRDFQPSGRSPNADGYGSRRSPSQSGPASASLSERSPFFSEYGPGKGEDDFNTMRKTETNGSKVSPTSPRGGGGPSLERRSTTDGTGGEDAQPKASGILGRMKSLKGRRQRPVPAAGDADATPVPGTAV
jgi:hypothetical protein